MTYNKKYNIWVSDRTLTFNEKEDGMDWEEGTGSKNKLVESHNTIWECLKSMEDWGSKWVMYPSVYIESEEDGEVWESTTEHTKCDKCGHETWDNTISSPGMPYKEFEEKIRQQTI